MSKYSFKFETANKKKHFKHTFLDFFWLLFSFNNTHKYTYNTQIHIQHTNTHTTHKYTYNTQIHNTQIKKVIMLDTAFPKKITYLLLLQ